MLSTSLNRLFFLRLVSENHLLVEAIEDDNAILAHFSGKYLLGEFVQHFALNDALQWSGTELWVVKESPTFQKLATLIMISLKPSPPSPLLGVGGLVGF